MPNSLSSTKVTDETGMAGMVYYVFKYNFIMEQVDEICLSENFAKKSHIRVFVTNHSGRNPEELGVLYIKMPFFM